MSHCSPWRPVRGPRPVPFRPWLEALEARTLPNNRFVVPLGTAIDNATTFGTLHAALTTGVHSAGEVIQIEPGSHPGVVGNADLTAPGVANLTIQGDPNAPLTAIPTFTVSNVVTIGSAESGFTLKNVNVELMTAASFSFDSSTTITGSAIVSYSGPPTSIFFVPGTANNVVNTVTDSTLASLDGGIMVLVDLANGDGSGDSNVFSNDVFEMASPSANGEYLLDYTSGGSPTVPTPADQVVNNTFLAAPGQDLFAMFYDSGNASGLTVQGNTFSDSDTKTIGIELNHGGDLATQSTNVIGNTLRLTGTSAVGISVSGGAAGSTTSAVLLNNQISTSTGPNGGTGLLLNAGSVAGAVVGVTAQGNDFHDNTIGVHATVQSFTSPAVFGADLGGGGQSGGGNDFRLLGPANSTQGPLVVTGTNPSVPVTIVAEHDTFSNTPPLSFVQGGLIHVTADTSNALSANAAFVETLYENELHRFGATTNPNDAGYWVNVLNANTMTPAQVAAAISHTPEALGVVVDGLYLKFLNRAADPNGRAGLVNYLKNGGTIEQVIVSLVTSAEYAADVGGTDYGYIESLYVKLLGRTGSNAEVSGWLAALPMQGRSGVANALLVSAEFRGDAAQQFYGFTLAAPASVLSLLPPLLHRTTAPSAADITSWVNSGLDVLSMAVAFAQTGEYFSNG